MKIFKPYEKILVKSDKWKADFYSYYDSEAEKHVTIYNYCVSDDMILPYEGNESLLGTNNDIGIYVRDIDSENEAIEEALEGHDFSALQMAIETLSKTDEYRWLINRDSKQLKDIAIQNIKNCFENMVIHGYKIYYQTDGDNPTYSYNINGVFSVETFYCPATGECWCSCKYNI